MNIGFRLVFFMLITACCGFVKGASINAIASVDYQPEQYVFVDGDSARGWVHFDKGFSVPAGASVTLNLLMPVRSTINLRLTGKIILDGDLFLSNGVLFSTGGKIDGQGHTIFLQGDMTIRRNRPLFFMSNTTIDGLGHTLTFEDDLFAGGKLTIDGVTGTTVTLKNIVLKGVKNSELGDPVQKTIEFGAASGQKLVLDNVVINLAGDCKFDGGALDIVGDTAIRGPYAFSYASSYDCTILKDATLMFDLGTTFKYNPSDKKTTHVVFADKSSQLFLNGCTISLPVKGLALTKGHLVIDNKVIVTGHDVVGPQALKESDGLIFGDGSVTNMLNVDMCSAARLELGSVMLVYRNVDGE